MGVILQTVEEELTSHIFSCATAYEMWTKLDATFGKVTAWTMQELLNEFYGLGLENNTPTELINKLQTIAGQLKAMGYPNLENIAVVGKTIHELRGPQYESFVEAWSVIPEKQKTIANLVQRLNMTEARHESWAKSEATEKAFSGQKPGKWNKEKGKPPAKGKKPGKCHNCGKPGHWKSECRSPPKAKKEPESEEKPAAPSTSQEKKRGDENRSFYGTVRKALSSTQGPGAKIGKGGARNEASRESYVWYCDSGTNVHLCGRKEWFSSYKKFDIPIRLQVASNLTADCPGEGTVTVLALIASK
jgi:hypothetical protein